MANQTAYDALVQNVLDIQSQISQKITDISALKNDAGINNLRVILSQVPNDSAWIDSSGILWAAPDAAAEHAKAVQQIRGQDQQIKSETDALGDLKTNLSTATQNVNDYEKNSPTLTQEMKDAAAQKIAEAKNASDQIAANLSESVTKSTTTRNVLIVLGVIAVLVIIAVVVVKINKGKKAKAAASTTA